MEDRLQGGYPTSTMLVFAVVWLGVIGYAAFNGEPSRKASIQAAHAEQEKVTDISSVAREADPETTGTIRARPY